MNSKDDLAVGGFANGVRYNAARPDYPREAIEHIVARLGVTRAMRALDLGAGTGIFTRQILPFVGHVTAVDPSASMRESLSSATPGVDVLEGSDVAIPLVDASVEAVFVAQAFHWFDAPRALLEIHRVLTPGGGLGLIWNERDETVEWVAALSHAMRWDRFQPYVVGTDFSASVLAGPFREVERVTFAHSQQLTREGLYQRVLTTSYISVMADRDREELMADVGDVVEQLGEPIVMPYVTDVYTARAVLAARVP